jgi:hypothetical protein
MKNIIVFFSDIQDKQILINSLNQDTSYIEYDSNTTNDTLLQLVTNETEYIGLLYHHYGYNNIPFFNNEYFMTFSCCDKNYLSNFTLIRTQFLKLICDLKEKNSNMIIDLLTCNVNDVLFIEELSKIKLVVRYSTNPAGNLSDWVQESHNINIKNIYFNDNIKLWDHLLVISLDTEEQQILALTRAAYGMKIVYPGYTGKIIKVRKELTYGFGLDPARWTLTRSVGTSSIQTLIYDTVIVRFNYGNNRSGYSGNWTFRTTSATAQTITLNWGYYACHSWFRPTANTYFWVGSTGTNVGTMRNGYGGCDSYNTGTTTFSVTAGQAWGIYVSGTNGDSARIVQGYVEIFDSTTPINDFFGNQDNETLINSNSVTLQNWLGTSNGYVVFWYDQSPNALHLNEAEISFQPLINKVDNSIVFNNKRLWRGGVLAENTSSYTYLATYKLNSLLNNQVIMEHSLNVLTNNRRASMMSINGSLYFAGQNNDLANIVSLTTTGFNKTIMQLNKSVNPIINVNHNNSSFSGNTAIPANLNIGTHHFLLGVNTTTTSEYLNGEIKYIVVINGAPNMSKTLSFFNKIQSTGTTYSLQSSGAISLSDVNTFLNRGNTSLIKFSDLYRTSGTLIGGLANLTAPNIPTTTGNAISLNNLRGASRIG